MRLSKHVNAHFPKKLIGHIAENLKFFYISDNDYFMQQLEINIRTQQSKLADDDIKSDFFYVTENEEAIPFNLSRETLPTISDSLIARIKEAENGVLYEQINGEQYTLSIQKMEEVSG